MGTEVFLEEIAHTANVGDAEMGKTNPVSISKPVNVGFLHLLTKYWPNLLISFGGTVAIATMWFVPPFWTLSAVLGPHLGSVDSLWVGNSAQLIGLSVTPIAGWLTDKMGVAWTLLAGAVFITATGLPVYTWLTFNPADRLSAYLGVGVFYGAAQGFSGAIIFLFVAELFPANVRCQGIAASYNIAVSFVGGFGSIICQALFESSPHIAPGIWFSATGLTTVITISCAVFFQSRGLVQLTHRRCAPYFGRAEPAAAVEGIANK